MWIDWLLPAALALGLDQSSKALVLARRGGGRDRSAGRWPRIRVIENPGPWPGSVRGRIMLALVWGVAVAGTILLMRVLPPFQETLAHVGLGTAIGGATGNLIDGLRRGAIVDFIDLRVWPVFNLADAAIVGGLGVAVWSVW